MWCGLGIIGIVLVFFCDCVGLLVNVIGWLLLLVGFGLLVFVVVGLNSVLGCWCVLGVVWLVGIFYSFYFSYKIVYYLV